jgi:inward rectifier potassium channel
MTTPSLAGEPAQAALPAQEEFKDLGFGSEVARGTNRRLLNRNGGFNVVLDGLNPFSSLSIYHWLLTISWPEFLAFIVACYIGVNVPDALQSITGSFAGHTFYRAFFFSVDSFATIGYGNIIPVGVPANLLVTIEALLNIVGVALATGVIFARFSRPSSRIIYSRNAIVAPYRGLTGLEFRIANGRRSQLIDVQVQAILTKIERTDGSSLRKFYELSLERNRVVFFPLSWTVVHPIDSQSPLWGVTRKDLIDGDAELLVLLIATDETVSQTVHSRSSYRADEIVWGVKFANMFMRTEAEGIIGMNLSQIHDVEPAALPIASGVQGFQAQTS